MNNNENNLNYEMYSVNPAPTINNDGGEYVDTSDSDPSINGGIVQTPAEHFSNMNVDLDKVLKAVFFGAIFYLLSQPEVYKMSKKCLGKVDGVLVHSVVFAVLYLVLNMFI